MLTFVYQLVSQFNQTFHKKQREIPTLFLKIKLFPTISKENYFLQYLFFS